MNMKPLPRANNFFSGQPGEKLRGSVWSRGAGGEAASGARASGGEAGVGRLDIDKNKRTSQGNLKEGVPPNNIPPVKLQSDEMELYIKPLDKMVCGGFDTLFLSYFIDFSPKSFYDISLQLKNAKKMQFCRVSQLEREKEVQEKGKEDEEQGRELWGNHDGAASQLVKIDRDSYVKFGPYELEVQPVGVREGYWFEWRFNIAGIQFLMRDQMSFSEKVPNIKVRIGSLNLMKYGHAECLGLVRNLISFMGGVVKKELVSRVDFCVDFADEDIEKWVSKIWKKQYVMRASKIGEHQTLYKNRSRVTGCQIGSHNLMMRIYDKAEEMRVQKSEDKQKVMELFRWGKQCEKAVRVEFQLSREKLHFFGINTVQQLEQKHYHLLRWLTEKWFRFTAEEPNKYNTERSKVWCKWEKVQEKFMSMFLPGEKIQERKKERVVGHQLFMQAIGCLQGLAAVNGWAAHNTTGLSKIFLDHYEEFGITQGEIFRRAELKKKQYRASGRVDDLGIQAREEAG